MGDDVEDFLLLDDEEETPVSEKPEKESFSLKSKLSSIKLPSLPKPKPKPSSKSEPAIEAVAASAGESIDLDLAADGVHEFEWDISGMDCPDCAMKAEKALRRLNQVISCQVSAIDGSVNLEVNFDTDTKTLSTTKGIQLFGRSFWEIWKNSYGEVFWT